MTSLLERSEELALPYDGRRRLVVIGNGMAGARTVEEILARGGADLFQITMFGDEPYGNYNRIMLSHLLSGESEETEIFLNSLAWYDENEITLHAGVRVTRIDRFAKVVFADDGSVTPYDDLIIATGSRSFMPQMENLDRPEGGLLPGVFAFRTLDDTRAMISCADRADHIKAVVIGGGLLGLEAARGLQRFGLAVDVVHAGGHLMNAQVGPQAGLIIQRSVEKLGIRVHTAARTTALVVGGETGEEKVAGVKLRGGGEIACDLVIIAAGIRPNVDVALTSGF